MPVTISCAPLLRCSQTLSVTCAETEDSGRILHPDPSAKVFLSAPNKKKKKDEEKPFWNQREVEDDPLMPDGSRFSRYD